MGWGWQLGFFVISFCSGFGLMGILKDFFGIHFRDSFWGWAATVVLGVVLQRIINALINRFTEARLDAYRDAFLAKGIDLDDLYNSR